MSLNGPFYLLEEAQVKLNLNQTDLLYSIQSGKIEPVLYSPKRQYLVISTDENRKCIGHAHFTYQGPIAADDTLFVKLAKQLKGNFFSSYRLIEPANISAIDYTYPLQNKLPNEALLGWSSVNKNEIFTDNYQIVAMPHEAKATQNLLKLFNDTLTTKTSFSPEDYAQKLSSVPYSYDWLYNGKWSIADLRIPSSEITRFLNPNVKSDSQRANQLHELILRVLKDHPKETNTSLWEIIRNDSKVDMPVYDVGKIIISVERGSITWKSDYDYEQTMKRKTFQNFVSNQRKK